MTSWPGVRALARSTANGTVSAAETARRVSAAIAARDAGADGLNAFVAHDPTLLAARGRALDEEVALGRDRGDAPGRLTGVPVAVKDNIVTLDHATTCGSGILEGYRSPYEATVVRRLRSAGALIAGTTNLDEFAMGSSTETSVHGPTRNPHDRARVPGGSSGGSAAVVAAGLVPAALGSDTGGSVRQPAAFCGVVGLKPTYGAVSRYGLVAFASSLDQVGTFGRTVEDAAALLEVIGGHDPLDATADRRTPSVLADLAATADAGPRLDGLVVGVPGEFFPDELDEGVRRRLDAALDGLRGAGAEVRDVSLPSTSLAIPTYYVIAPAEASSNLARYDGVRYGARAAAGSTDELYRRTRSGGFGREVKRRIMLGTYVLSAGYHDRYYGRAQRARARIRGDFARVFEAGVDVLFTPTTPTPAFRLGEKLDDPLQMYLADMFTVSANLAGVPAISVPVGTVNGLPVGGQLMAAWWREPTLIRAAAALEAVVRDGGVGPIPDGRDTGAGVERGASGGGSS